MYSRGSDRRFSSGDSNRGSSLQRFAIGMKKEGQSQIFTPMYDAKNNPCHISQVGHTLRGEGRSDTYACTKWNDLPQYRGKCYFCQEIRKFDEDFVDFRDRDLDIKDVHFVGVWDPSYYVPQKRDNKTYYDLWVAPKRRGSSGPPPEAVIGGKRFFQMGKNTWTEFMIYEGIMQDTCCCVAHTGEPKISSAYVRVAICPKCKHVIVNEDDLDQIRTSEEVRKTVLQRLYKCVSAEEGGCWTEEKEKKAMEHMFYPEPVWGCMVNDKDTNICNRPEALEISGRPALVTRRGEGYQTKYEWERALPWREWVEYSPPPEALEAFAEGINNSLKVISPIQQAKLLGIQPDEEDMHYSKEYTRSAVRGGRSEKPEEGGKGKEESRPEEGPDDSDDKPVFRRPRH